MSATSTGKLKAGHIVTIEDPIEYFLTPKKSIINQRELYADTLSYTNALRSVLREDPDVVLVGEMRDLETIETAIKATETGHLVFSTVHTTDASKTISRLIGVFPSG
jgi:twitching motility protein PilT